MYIICCLGHLDWTSAGIQASLCWGRSVSSWVSLSQLFCLWGTWCYTRLPPLVSDRKQLRLCLKTVFPLFYSCDCWTVLVWSVTRWLESSGWFVESLCYQVLSSAVMWRCCLTLETSACPSFKRATALTSTTTSAWILSSMETCRCCHLEPKLPWSPSRRSTSTTHRVSRVSRCTRKLRAQLCLTLCLSASASRHLHLCPGVYGGFRRARLRVLHLPPETEHNLPWLSPQQPRRRSRDPADHHGEGICDVRQGGADTEIRHH